MKSILKLWIVGAVLSHPARGAWIEIHLDISIIAKRILSHPARGAWIEMRVLGAFYVAFRVAPRKGCVD